MSSIGKRVFNTFSKNFMAKINDEVHKSEKRNSNDPKIISSARKVKKLLSG